MLDGTVEIITGKELYPSLLFNWRRQVREGRLVPYSEPSFVPVRLIGSSTEKPALPTPRATMDKANAGAIEIALPDGTRLYIKREAQVPLLRPVIAALRG